jgi:hypothetical protein
MADVTRPGNPSQACLSWLSSIDLSDTGLEQNFCSQIRVKICGQAQWWLRTAEDAVPRFSESH